MKGLPVVHSAPVTLVDNPYFKFLIQLQIQAEDGGFPVKTAVQPATIIINVIRNKNTPQFTQTSYSATIRKNLGFGNRVVQIQARDSDPEVRN